jgi:hypothetical protein
MKSIFLLLLPMLALGQAVRIDPFWGNPMNPFGSAPRILGTVPNSTVVLCNNATLPCTSFATTYTDASGATQCPSAKQVVVHGTNVCTNVAGADGNFGFWVAGQTAPYWYSYTPPGAPGPLGPWPISAGGGGGGSSVTWPATNDIVISNSSNSPLGLAPVNGDCVIGSAGVWTTLPCSGTPVSVTSADGGIAISPSPGVGTFTVDLANKTATANQFYNSIVGGLLTGVQPSFANLSGQATTAQLPSSAVVSNMPGATPGTVYINTNTCSATGTNLSCTGASFTSANVGNAVCIEKGASSTAALCTTFATYVSATAMTLTTGVTSPVSPVRIVYGPDNTSAFSTWAASGAGATLPTGTYYVNTDTSGAITITNPQTLWGIGGPVTIYCMSQTNPCFVYNFGGNTSSAFESGMVGVRLEGANNLGTAGTTTAIQLGAVSGAAVGVRFDDVIVENFYHGVTITNGSFYVNLSHFYGRFNQTSLLVNSSLNDSENIQITDDSVFQYGGSDLGVTSSQKCIDIESTVFPLAMSGGSIVNCGIYINANGSMQLNGVHSEAANAASTNNGPFIAITSSSSIQLTLNDPSTVNVGNGQSGAAQNNPPYWITVAGGTVDVNGGNFFNNASGAPILAQVTGAAKVRFHRPFQALYTQGFTDFLSSTGTSNSVVDPLGAPALIATAYSAKQDDNYIICNGGTAAVTLPNNPWYGQTILISDATTSSCVITDPNGKSIAGAGGSTLTLNYGPGTFPQVQLTWDGTLWETKNIFGSPLRVYNAGGTYGFMDGTQFVTTNATGTLGGSSGNSLVNFDVGGTAFWQLTSKGLWSGQIVSIPSASSLSAITDPIVLLTGTTPVNTITPPSGCTSTGYGCTVEMLIDSATGPASFGTTGNIYNAVSPLSGSIVTLTYYPATSKWYISSSSGGGSSYTFSAPLLNTSGTVSLTLGPSGALQTTSGYLDVVTSVVPLKASANAFTGGNSFAGASFIKPVTVSATAPPCATAGTDTGNFWLNTTSSTANHLEVCATVSSALGWQTIF